ncbi:PadR family transcriptional regulator [Planosporangium sp. 12N6]|uniref:PadR family transcriptional regulator n=1 Tax=Planosporangium spinosum TaxID=3402278 RepID=UPI003CF4F82E
MSRGGTVSDLNPTSASLLGFLHEGDFTGYDLVKVARMLIGDFWSLTQSQVYRELAGLADRGLVTVGETGPRSRRPYRITEAGRAAFRDWIRRPPGGEQIRYPLLLTLAFGAHLDPDELLEFVAEQRRTHERRLREYRDTGATLPLDRYQRATLAFGLRYEQAVIDWMNELPGILGEEPPA